MLFLQNVFCYSETRMVTKETGVEIKGLKKIQEKLAAMPLWIPVVVVVVLVVIGLAYTQGWLFSAKVNGQYISRVELIEQLEQNYGQMALENLIVEKLIVQEAAKRGVKLTQDEIKQKEAEIAKSVPGGDLEAAIKAQGMTRAQFNNQLRLNMLVEKMVLPDINISDADIDKYIEANKSTLDMKATNLRDQVKETLKQDKLYQEAGNLIKSLQDSAKIQRFF